MTADLTLYFLAVLAVILLPGMDMAYVLASSLFGGRRGAVSSVLGIATGGLIHVVVGATGMAALMMMFPQLFHVLLLLGTCYLLWIGWTIFRSADADTTQTDLPVASSGAIYRRAVTTCLLNPKAYAFMFAIFPAFVRSDTRSLVAQTIALCLITVAIQIVVYGAVAALAVQSRQFMKSRQKTISRTMGAMLMAAALATATQAWSVPTEKSPSPNAPTTTTTPATPTKASAAITGSASTKSPASEQKGRDDFDFLVGHWQTVQRRSTKPLQDDAPWETFSAAIHMEKLPGNIGNIDAMTAPDWRPNWVGVAIRIFNGETGLWSIYWLAGKTGGIDSATGQLTVPVVGKFENEVGIFESDEIVEGKALRVRFTWTKVDTDHVKWQQAFSFDGGKSWKPNWHMHGTRVKQ
ncbi:MAG: LysE family translocator [Burkholderiales bacterium]|nr:LysE family translocator [Burkholderiales bacterium]